MGVEREGESRLNRILRVVADMQNYLVADVPGSTISFAFTTAIGTVDLYFLRSKEFGLGNVRCWVDDDVDNAVKLEGYWTNGANIGQWVDDCAHEAARADMTGPLGLAKTLPMANIPCLASSWRRRAIRRAGQSSGSFR
jgi:hypothetical protein